MDAAAFLTQYGFDLGGRSSEEWLVEWQRTFPQSWIASALVEALFRGRYKAVSVQQILVLWQARGTPCMGFGLEFGRKVWPEGVDRLQSGLEQGSTSTLTLRSYAFQSFDSPEGPTAEDSLSSFAIRDRNPTITMYPLRRQLRWESVPEKLHEMLLV